MDIAALSLINSQMNVQNDASILVLKKAMDTAELNSQTMISDLVPPSPHVGNSIDIKV
ncbi:hypothetical protein SPFL3102_02025 [Sporomusaceae bacterium FL31]|nr:hypothetical protein SPFL3101_03659 [Sporomusaceae bacterium FL31]GCE34214.1 hypothetical protein SPFL3102_02025 [Sporomusaceae bacterium]